MNQWYLKIRVCQNFLLYHSSITVLGSNSFITEEYGFVYNDRRKPKTINSLIKAIKKKNYQENSEYQWILLIDELNANDGDDFTFLYILEDIDVLIGVSPNRGKLACYTYMKVTF